MEFVGYVPSERLPIRRGQEVVIPPGVEVISMRPSRKRYVTSRTQRVRVASIDNGRSVNIMLYVADDERYRYAGHEAAFTAYDELELQARTEPDPEIARRNWNALREMTIPVSNPRVIWAGYGLYWCSVDINAVVAANGIVA